MKMSYAQIKCLIYHCNSGTSEKLFFIGVLESVHIMFTGCCYVCCMRLTNTLFFSIDINECIYLHKLVKQKKYCEIMNTIMEHINSPVHQGEYKNLHISVYKVSQNLTWYEYKDNLLQGQLFLTRAFKGLMRSFSIGLAGPLVPASSRKASP